VKKLSIIDALDYVSGLVTGRNHYDVGMDSSACGPSAARSRRARASGRGGAPRGL